MAIDWPSVSARIRGLIQFPDDNQVAAAATRLDVPEEQLRDAMQDKSRRATINVVAAAVSHYGLDPTWMLTGTYDDATHRMAKERATKEDCF